MSLLPSPAPDFDDPLGLLAACHQRMLDHCALLERLPAWLSDQGIDDDARHLAERVLRYFDTAARHHHADEEEDLFPLLRSNTALVSLLDTLEREHATLEDAWRRLAPLLKDILDGRTAPELDTTIGAFVIAYRQHIDRENTELLPAAGRLLTPAQVTALGQAMANRRGVDTRG